LALRHLHWQNLDIFLSYIGKYDDIYRFSDCVSHCSVIDFFRNTFWGMIKLVYFKLFQVSRTKMHCVELSGFLQLIHSSRSLWFDFLWLPFKRHHSITHSTCKKNSAIIIVGIWTANIKHKDIEIILATNNSNNNNNLAFNIAP